MVSGANSKLEFEFLAWPMGIKIKLLILYARLLPYARCHRAESQIERDRETCNYR